MKKDAVLIIGAGLLQIPMIQEAKKLGLYTIATDQNREAPGARIADDFYKCDTYDAEKHAELVPRLMKHYNIKGVATCGADVAPTVARAAEAAGTPGIPPRVAWRTHRKHMVKARLACHNISMPDWTNVHFYCDSPKPAEVIRRCLTQWENGVVIKPQSQCASRGVTIIKEAGQIEGALQKIEPYIGDSGAFLAEECLTGSEHSVEMILDEETGIIFFNIVDRLFSYVNGVPMELGHINPSRMDDNNWTACMMLAQNAARELGVYWGPFKCDMILTENGPKILECTARLSGGFDCQYTTPLATGRNPIRAVLEMACAMPVNRYFLDWKLDAEGGKLQHRYAACAAAFPLLCGRVRNPLPEFAFTRKGAPVLLTFSRERPPTFTEHQIPDVEEIFITVKDGDVIGPYTHCAQRPGFAIAVNENYDIAWNRAKNAAELLEVGLLIEYVGGRL